jgi:Tfp pilus assembly protein PilX
MTRRIEHQDGSALVTAMLVMFMFLITGFAVISNVETQTRDSGRERTRESSFQLAEGVLNSAIYRLSQTWPGQVGTAFPAQCTIGVPSQNCPSDQYLRNAFNTPDFKRWGTNVRWSVQVRDNGGAYRNYYSDAILANQPSFDAAGNADGTADQKMWVRAQALVGGRRRTLVALIKAENLQSGLPTNKTLVAGYFETTNNGNKVIVDNGANGDIVVRCGSGGAITGNVNDCAEFQANKGQVTPLRITSDTAFPPALSPESLDAVRALAQAQGNYYQGCAPSLQGDVPGEVVFIEDAGSSGCSYTSNSQFNTPTQRGAVVIAKGKLTLGGTSDFYGVIYPANVNDSNAVLLSLQGNAVVHGGALIDGRGGAALGSSKNNLVFDGNAASALKIFGTAGIVQNSFREINATS